MCKKISLFFLLILCFIFSAFTVAFADDINDLHFDESCSVLKENEKFNIKTASSDDIVLRFTPQKENEIYSLHLPSDILFYNFESDCPIMIVEKSLDGKINTVCKTRYSEYVPGIHGAFDFTNLKKDKEYFIILRLCIDYAKLYENCDEFENDMMLNFDISMTPNQLEFYNIESNESEFNSFESFCYYGLKVSYKYEGEEKYEYNTTLSRSGFLKCDNTDFLYNKKLLKIGTTTVKIKYLNYEILLPIKVTSGYERAKGEHRSYRLDNHFILDSEEYGHYIYYMFTVPDDGVYDVMWRTTERNKNGEYQKYTNITFPDRIFKISDDKNNFINYKKNDGYYLKKGKRYAVYYFNDSFLESIDGSVEMFRSMSEDEIYFSEPKYVITKSRRHIHKNKVTKKAIAATYTKAGRTSEIRCSLCNAIIKASKVIPKKKLSAPTITKISKNKKNKNKITIKWKKVTGATHYYVYRYNAKTKKYVKIATLNSKKLSYTDKKFKFTNKIKTYYVKIKAVRIEKKKLVSSSISAAKKIKR